MKKLLKILCIATLGLTPFISVLSYNIIEKLKRVNLDSLRRTIDFARTIKQGDKNQKSWFIFQEAISIADKITQDSEAILGKVKLENEIELFNDSLTQEAFDKNEAIENRSAYHFNAKESKERMSTGLSHASTEYTKFFARKGATIKLKWSVDNFDNFDELVMAYPGFSDFYFEILLKGSFAYSYNFKENYSQIINNAKDAYNKELEIIVLNDGIISYKSLPWLNVKINLDIKSNNDQSIQENYFVSYEDIQSKDMNKKFWDEMIEQAKAKNYTTEDIKDKEDVPEKPFIILNSHNIIYVIQTKRFWANLNYLITEKGRDFENYSLMSTMLYLDKVRQLSDESYGLSTENEGTSYKDNFKLAIWDNDSGAGTYYATNEYISMHGSLGGKDGISPNESWKLGSEGIYEKSILSESNDLSKTKSINESLRLLSSNPFWGLFHEIGHTYQNPLYKLSWWGEVTVNINSYMVTRKLIDESNLTNEEKDSIDESWMTKWGAKHSDQLNKWSEQNIYTFDIYSKYSELSGNIDGNTMGALMWFQLISSFGENYIPMLNQYYRTLQNEISKITNNSPEMTSDQKMLDLLMMITSKITKTNFLKFTEKWKIILSDETIKVMESFGQDQSDIMLKNVLTTKWYETKTISQAEDNLKDYSIKTNLKEEYIKKNINNFEIYNTELDFLIPSAPHDDVNIKNYQVILKEKKSSFYNSFTLDALTKEQQKIALEKIKIKNRWTLSGNSAAAIVLEESKNNELNFFIVSGATKSIHQSLGGESPYMRIEVWSKNNSIKETVDIMPNIPIKDIKFNSINIDEGDYLEMYFSEESRSNYFDKNDFTYKNIGRVDGATEVQLVGNDGVGRKYTKVRFYL